MEIWTPYAGPLYEEFDGASLTDMEAVTTRNCALRSGGPDGSDLVLSCGQDRIRIPEVTWD